MGHAGNGTISRGLISRMVGIFALQAFWLLACSLHAAPPPAQQLAEPLDLLKQLNNVALDPTQVYAIRDARITRGRMDLYLNRGFIDRKSTRLNSSHLGISYAVFC